MLSRISFIMQEVNKVSQLTHSTSAVSRQPLETAASFRSSQQEIPSFKIIKNFNSKTFVAKKRGSKPLICSFGLQHTKKDMVPIMRKELPIDDDLMDVESLSSSSSSSSSSSHSMDRLNPENLLSDKGMFSLPRSTGGIMMGDYQTKSECCTRQISYPSYSSPERAQNPNRLSLLYKNHSVLANRVRSKQRHNISPMLEETEHVNVFLKSQLQALSRTLQHSFKDLHHARQFSQAATPEPGSIVHRESNLLNATLPRMRHLRDYQTERLHLKLMKISFTSGGREGGGFGQYQQHDRDPYVIQSLKGPDPIQTYRSRTCLEQMQITPSDALWRT